MQFISSIYNKINLSIIQKENKRSLSPSIRHWKLLIAGLVFSILWSSASTATKLGLSSAQPFVIASARFLVAGLILLFISHVLLGNRLPAKLEWRPILLFGLLNITIYLGLYVLAMQQVSAGLGSLAVAINPVLIALISGSMLSQKITQRHWLSLLMCLLGVLLAAFPLLQNSYATPLGIGLLIGSMVVYSFGTIFYSRIQWNGLHLLTINGWQTILGGLFLFPLLVFTYQPDKNSFDHNFWNSVAWLAIPVSIGAVQLWLYLIRHNPMKASFWLFLCPIFGFASARIMLNEPISWHTALGVLMVLLGLYLVQKINK